MLEVVTFQGSYVFPISVLFFIVLKLDGTNCFLKCSLVCAHPEMFALGFGYLFSVLQMVCVSGILSEKIILLNGFLKVTYWISVQLSFQGFSNF